MKLFDTIIWHLNRVLFEQILKKKYNLQYADNCDSLPDSAYIMVANHANFFDPWILVNDSPKTVSIMMNEEGFKAGKMTQWYLQQMGAFPKKKGGTDVRSMKTALRRLKAGNPLLIFPEGQTTWDGETQPIYSGIEKMILHSKVPLVLVNVAGNFLSRPWWSTRDRKGAIIVQRRVIQPDELATMSATEVRDEITNYIYNNDCTNSELNNVTFESDAPADGLHRLLWRCPSCLKEDQLVFSDTQVTCSACSHEFNVTPNLAIINDLNVDSIHHWVSIQKASVKAMLESEEEQLLNSEGIRLIDVAENGKVITLDTGRLTLSRDTLEYHGNESTLSFNMKEMSQPVFQQKDIIQFELGNKTIRFFIENTALYKWLTYLRYITGYERAEVQRYY